MRSNRGPLPPAERAARRILRWKIDREREIEGSPRVLELLMELRRARRRKRGTGRTT